MTEMFNMLEELGKHYPQLRGYYSRGTGGVDWEGIARELRKIRHVREAKGGE